MRYALICFDVDGTLIQDRDRKNYWFTLHTVIEGLERGKRTNDERYALFLSGKLSYKDWVDLDIGTFQQEGATKADFERAARLHQLMPGARETILELHRRGYKLAVISGSLNILIDMLFPDHPFEDVYTNTISFGKDGRIDGWKETVFDQGTKHKALLAICEREGIPLSQTIFVGDGENDIDILKEAGLGIAFCPKSDRVRAAADVVIESDDLREILRHVS